MWRWGRVLLLLSAVWVFWVVISGWNRNGLGRVESFACQKGTKGGDRYVLNDEEPRPDFILIGAAKGGTTSFSNYLRKLVYDRHWSAYQVISRSSKRSTRQGEGTELLQLEISLAGQLPSPIHQ